MNREIKFRAWDKKRKVMITAPWRLSITYVEGKLTVFDQKESGDQIDCDLMQFTGLKDKNGKEIYEGDIITNVWGYFECVFVVKWDLYGFRLQSITDRFEMSKDEWTDCPTHLDLTEIIGNIYENPELLTTGSPASSEASE